MDERTYFRMAASTAAALLAASAPSEAGAQFFHLQGFLECIDHPETRACRERLRQAPEDPAAAEASTRPQGGGSPPKEAPRARFTAVDLKQAIARVQANRATGSDMAVLEAKAHDDDPAAVEVLAWCKLHGCRGLPDRVAAYRLYGRAIALDVPHARENQRIIFEHLMTEGERKKALAADGGP